MLYDPDRLIEALLVFITAAAATAARVIHGLVDKFDTWPRDPEAARVWRLRLYWAVAGEMAAVITFVMVAEALVIYRNWSSPVAVLIGAGAAVLGYPFLAGLFRRRVEQRMQTERVDG